MIARVDYWRKLRDSLEDNDSDIPDIKKPVGMRTAAFERKLRLLKRVEDDIERLFPLVVNRR